MSRCTSPKGKVNRASGLAVYAKQEAVKTLEK